MVRFATGCDQGFVRVKQPARAFRRVAVSTKGEDALARMFRIQFRPGTAFGVIT